MGKIKVAKEYSLRRELAEYVLKCSDEAFIAFLCALETDNSIPNFFNCEKCKELFGECPIEDGVDLFDACTNRIAQFEEMKNNEIHNRGL